MNQISYEERMAVYREAVKQYGIESQLNKFDEELGEFMTELGRMRNGYGHRFNFSDELADLTIMLEQLRMIFGVNDAVCERMDYKILRLQARLGFVPDTNVGSKGG